MKHRELKLFVFIIFISSLLSISADSQRKITDSDFSNRRNSIEGVSPERTVVGKVVGVHDGDTATVLDANKTPYKIRFNGIDAPELKQDFGQKSKQNLSKMIFGQTVTIVFSKKDKYNRFVGNILIGGVDVNLEQIKAGMAWHFKRYSGEQSETNRAAYSEAETKAKAARLGLWSQTDPIAPWDYRTKKKANQETEKARRKYLVGAKGGCYYINSNGNKTYVKKQSCN